LAERLFISPQLVKKTMFTILVIIILLVGLLMSAMILAQNPKGNGLAGALGAPGSVGTMFGARRTADFLVKATIALAAIFIVFSIATNRFFLPTEGTLANPLREGPAPSANSPLPGAGQQQVPVQQAPAPAQPAK
jgi:preprotein translocase subunit SecG